jgi:hypothetical protein
MNRHGSLLDQLISPQQETTRADRNRNQERFASSVNPAFLPRNVDR